MNQLLAVFFYEWRRTLTAGRIGWWFALAAFPVLITLLIRSQSDFYAQGVTVQEVDTIWAVLFYMLIPCVCCALGAFLNAAPALASELEQRSWIYLATRPQGILWLLVGKYLVAIVWSITSAIASITMCVLISEMDMSAIGIPSPAYVNGVSSPQNVDQADLSNTDGGRQRPQVRSRIEVVSRLWFTMVRLSVLSAMAYSALYLMIGAMFPRRAMVFCVFYTGLVEVVLSLLPAIINRLTIQYRLRSLMINWAEPAGRDQMQNNIFFRYVFAEGSNIEQIIWLLSLSGIFLTAAIAVAHWSEFTGASESDV